MLAPQKIEELGGAFYRAFLEVDLSDGPGFLPHFPEGCCGWATYMVGNYLKFECELDPKEASGTRIEEDGSCEHLWVDIEGTIIDLTCGQFKDCPFPYFIGPRSCWHEQWIDRKFNEIHQISKYDTIKSTENITPSQIYERLTNKVRTLLA